MLFGVILQIVASGLAVVAPVLGIIAVIAMIALFVPTLAVGARRLHDRNMSGWFQLLLILPLIGFLILAVLWAMKGTDGDNKYGSEP